MVATPVHNSCCGLLVVLLSRVCNRSPPFVPGQFHDCSITYDKTFFPCSSPASQFTAYSASCFSLSWRVQSGSLNVFSHMELFSVSMLLWGLLSVHSLGWQAIVAVSLAGFCRYVPDFRCWRPPLSQYFWSSPWWLLGRMPHAGQQCLQCFQWCCGQLCRFPCAPCPQILWVFGHHHLVDSFYSGFTSLFHVPNGSAY